MVCGIVRWRDALSETCLRKACGESKPALDSRLRSSGPSPVLVFQERVVTHTSISDKGHAQAL